MTTPRQLVSFPDVAIIHKGTPKQIIEKDGRKVEIQGKDLNNKFRLHFLPGTDDVRADWHKKHAAEFKNYGDKYTIPTGYEVEIFRVVVPAPTVWDAWDYGNEVYNAGRRLALANDEQYLFLRDPLTGKITIRDGQPFKKFIVGEKIVYIRDGKEYALPFKSHGRLRLVLEDLFMAGHLVQVILKTTSYYDCQNIQKQLAGIQTIADMVNGGNAGGVPMLVYRSEQEVVWNKPDGGAMRVKKWFINIKADPNWVKFAFAQMGKRALMPGALKLLETDTTISGSASPEEETFDSGDEEIPDFDDGEHVDEEDAAAPITAEASAGDAQKHPYNGETIVAAVAKRAGVSRADAAKWLAQARKENRIEATLTEAEALEFASHLNV